MSINEIALPQGRRQIYALTILLSLAFFALIFYFRNTLEDFSQPFIYVLLGISLIVVISGRFEAFLLIILIITSTVFELLEFPTIPIMIGDLYFSDILILLLLMGRLIKRVTVNVVLIPKPLGYPIVACILVAVFSFLYSTMGFHVPTNTAGIELRAIIHLCLFFLVFYYVKNDPHLKSLLLGLSLTAVAVAGLLILQYVLGRDTSIVSGRLEILNTSGQKFKDVIRILVPGSSLIFFVLNTLMAVYILKGLQRSRLWLLLGIAVLMMGMILTFTRVFWVMILAGVLILLFLARRRAIIYPRISFLLFGVFWVIVVFMQSRALNPEVIEAAIYNRSLSILRAPSNFQHDTLFMRYLESRYAWEKIKESPFLGLGLGRAYRPQIFGKIEYENATGGTFLHNGYLATQLKMGLPGTLTFFWLILAFFARMLKRWRKIQNPLYQAVVLGITMSIGGMLLHNLVASPFLTVFGASVAGLALGVVEKIYQFEGLA
ncbi:MAG TPA: O-antigen ligase family protein [bacterium]|jgi:O-antigen ligase